MEGDKERKQEPVDVSLKELNEKLAEFTRERGWEKFHNPRNLLLAMITEVGELSEIFPMEGEVSRGLPDWEERDKQHLGEELSDVLLYLLQLASACEVDLGDAVTKKIAKNAVKYPAKLSQP